MFLETTFNVNVMGYLRNASAVFISHCTQRRPRFTGILMNYLHIFSLHDS